MLAYNLVRTATDAPEPTVVEHSRSHRRIAEATERWLKDPSAPSKLLLPLEHKYSETNLAFAGLKRQDKAMVGVLQSAKAEGGTTPLLQVHLALLTKHVSGQPEDEGYGGRSRYGRRRGWYDDSDDDDDDGGDPGMAEIDDTEVSIGHWQGPSGAVDFPGLRVDLEAEMMGDGEDPFPEEHDKHEYEGYQGNYAGTVEYWYHTAVAVVWPASRAFEIAIESGFGAALGLAETLLAQGQPQGPKAVSRLVAYASTYPYKVWPGHSGSQDTVTGRLLKLCQDQDQTLQVLRLCGATHTRAGVRWSVALGSTAAAHSVCDAIRQFGWEALGAAIEAMLLLCTSSGTLSNALTLFDLLARQPAAPPAAARVLQVTAKAALSAGLPDLGPSAVIDLTQRLLQHDAGHELLPPHLAKVGAEAGLGLILPLLDSLCALDGVVKHPELVPASPSPQHPPAGWAVTETNKGFIRTIFALIPPALQRPDASGGRAREAVRGTVLLLQYGDEGLLSQQADVLTENCPIPVARAVLGDLVVAQALAGGSAPLRALERGTLARELQALQAQAARGGVPQPTDVLTTVHALVGLGETELLEQFAAFAAAPACPPVVVAAVTADFRCVAAVRSGDTPLRRVFAARAAHLARLPAPAAFSWCMPAARHPRPEVERFLQPPQEALQYQQFTGITEARQMARGLECVKASGGFTVTASAAGVGRNAYCVIRKTRAWFDIAQATFLTQRWELEVLTGHLQPHGPGLGTPTANRQPPTDSPTPGGGQDGPSPPAVPAPLTGDTPPPAKRLKTVDDPRSAASPAPSPACVIDLTDLSQ